MIRQPSEATPELVSAAAAQVSRQKGIPTAGDVRLETYDEGRAAQVLHVGPYSSEGPTIECLNAYVRELGGHFDGRRQRHHEIYVGDPRRAAPDRLHTILRQPFSLTSDEEPDRRTA